MTEGRTDARTDRLNPPKPNKGATFVFFQNNERDSILVHRKHTRPAISQRPANGENLGFLIAIYSESNL
jgi:hypothetical protein